MKLVLRVLAVLLLCAPAMSASAQEKKKYKLLYISQSKGFKHGSVDRKDKPLAPSEIAITEIGKETGLFDVECTQDASILTPDKLKELDAVMFYTTGNLPISTENFSAFEAWLQSGKAMIGVHSATDTFGGFKPYFSLINGTFDGHPWGSGETVAITNHEPGHATSKMLGEAFQFKDEIYQYRNHDPKAVRVIYSLDMAKCKTKQPYHVPVSWVREAGQGRLFYTNLGHNEGTWTNPVYRQHLLQGIRWALKLEEGPATPNPELSYREQARAFIQVAGAEAGKTPEPLLAKVEKADAEWLAGLYGKIDAHRRTDAKRDGEKKKALRDEILAEIEKK
jgi:uncharacterized protein